MIFSASRVKGGGLYHMGGGRYVGIDRASEPDRHVECEVEVQGDGTIKVLDVREYPARPESR